MPKRKWNSLLFWGTVWKLWPCYENMPLLINTGLIKHEWNWLDFLNESESVKEPMKLEHELLIKREKFNELADNQCTCETGCGFPTMSEYKWYINYHLFNSVLHRREIQFLQVWKRAINIEFSCVKFKFESKKFSVSFKLSQKIMTNKLKCYLHEDSIKIVQFGMKFYYLILLLYNNQKNVTSDKITNNVSKKKKSLI